MAELEPPTDDYDELTVEQVKARVREYLSGYGEDYGEDYGEPGEEPLDPVDVYAYESENKQRVTLLRWLDDFVGDLEDEEQITVAPTRKRRVATFWIDDDDLYKPMTVTRTPKIDEAIEAGALQVIDR